MPRFFFDVADGEFVAHDEEGDDLLSWQEAREYADDLLPDIAKADLTSNDRRVFAIQIRDEAGQVGYKATLTFAAEWVGDRPPVSAK